VEESPCEGSDIVEELERVFGPVGVDGGCTEEDLEVGVDFFRGGVRDSVVVVAIETRSPRALCEICGNRRS
jgi:hypothetical protein